MNACQFLYSKSSNQKQLIEDTCENDKVTLDVISKTKALFEKTVTLHTNHRVYKVIEESYERALQQRPLATFTDPIIQLQGEITHSLDSLTKAQNPDAKIVYKKLISQEKELDVRIERLRQWRFFYEPKRELSRKIDFVFSCNERLKGYEKEHAELLSSLAEPEISQALTEWETEYNDFTHNLNRGRNKFAVWSGNHPMGASWDEPKAYPVTLEELTEYITENEVEEFVSAWTKSARAIAKQMARDPEAKIVHIALKAYQLKQLTLEDAAFIAYLWSLGTDYGSDMVDLQIVSLETPEGFEAIRSNLESHLLIKLLNPKHNSYKSPQEIEAIKKYCLKKSRNITRLSVEYFQESVKSGQRSVAQSFVVTFKLGLPREKWPSFYREAEAGISYNLFFPQYKEGENLLVIPTLGYYRCYLRAMHGDNFVDPSIVLALSTAEDIFYDLSKKQHQTGINVPGLEPMVNVNGTLCNLSVFTDHDRYHCDTASYIPDHHSLTFQRIFEKFLIPIFQKRPLSYVREDLFITIDRDHYYYRHQIDEVDRKLALKKIHQKNFENCKKEGQSIAFIRTLKTRIRFLDDDTAYEVENFIRKDCANWLELGWSQEELDFFKRRF